MSPLAPDVPADDIVGAGARWSSRWWLGSRDSYKTWLERKIRDKITRELTESCDAQLRWQNWEKIMRESCGCWHLLWFGRHVKKVLDEGNVGLHIIFIWPWEESSALIWEKLFLNQNSRVRLLSNCDISYIEESLHQSQVNDVHGILQENDFLRSSSKPDTEYFRFCQQADIREQRTLTNIKKWSRQCWWFLSRTEWDSQPSFPSDPETFNLVWLSYVDSCTWQWRRAQEQNGRDHSSHKLK